MRARRSDRAAAARRRRRVRLVRRAAAAAVTVAAVVLVIRWTAGPGAVDYAAGFISGAAACCGLVLVQRSNAERWARRAGVAARAAVDRPLPRVPKPARTPIHDSAVHQQEGA